MCSFVWSMRLGLCAMCLLCLDQLANEKNSTDSQSNLDLLCNLGDRVRVA